MEVPANNALSGLPVVESIVDNSLLQPVVLPVEEGDADDSFLSGIFVLVSQNEAVSNGSIFVEGILKDDFDYEDEEVLQMQEDLRKRLSSIELVFQEGDNLLADYANASNDLGPLYEWCDASLKSLRIVEYTGSQSESKYISVNSVPTNVQLFGLYHEETVMDENLHADITDIPHVRIHGAWDQLVFEDDYKRDLIWMMTNTLRLSERSSETEPLLDPIILLHGPPGTGKTTLCQGLAQKISIRLQHKYERTKLVQLKTATLLSKYFSESAKMVDQIFTTLASMCQQEPNEFLCVLVDEVESIALSREGSMNAGECQDALRATNSLLTGLDRVKMYPNILFLCTSNMISFLEPAFLDRCGQVLEIRPPSKASQYAILCRNIMKLVDRKFITTEDEEFPSFDTAIVQSMAGLDKVGAKLLGIVELVESRNKHLPSHRMLSGRYLKRLAGHSIAQYLREEECSLDAALGFMKKSLLSEHKTLATMAGKDKPEEVYIQEISSHGGDGSPIGIDYTSGRKRKFKLIIESEECKAKKACFLIEDKKDLELAFKWVTEAYTRDKDKIANVKE